jgi:hypothetical protein
MKLRKKCRILSFKRKAVVTSLPGSVSVSEDEPSTALRAIGWASVAVGVTALGLYIGREIRARYKFRRRTPADFFSHAGEEFPTEYGMGI